MSLARKSSDPIRSLNQPLIAGACIFHYRRASSRDATRSRRIASRYSEMHMPAEERRRQKGSEKGRKEGRERRGRQRNKKRGEHRGTQKDRASLYVRNRSSLPRTGGGGCVPIGNRYRLSKAKPEPARLSRGRYARTHSKAEEIHACSLQTEAGLRRSIYGIARGVLAPISPVPDPFLRLTPLLLSQHPPSPPSLPSLPSLARAPIIPPCLRLCERRAAFYELRNPASLVR